MSRDNARPDIPRASTYQNINIRYDVLTRGNRDRMAALRLAHGMLQRTLDMHRAGYSHVKAANVYQAALDLASHAIALAEHGTEGYPYASQIPTGQSELPLDEQTNRNLAPSQWPRERK